jgi:hypothetical protein
MRTKTLALTAVLGMIGAASAMAQTPVYSLNAVGYINATIFPGFQIMSCPLIAPNGNSIGALFPNGGGGTPTSNQWNNLSIYNWDTAITNYDPSDTANAKQANKSGYTNGWTQGGTNTMWPGQGVWVFWSGGSPTNVTFVGTVPQNGSPYLTNTMVPGFNMVASAIPMDGDLYTNTNTLMTGFENGGDAVYTFDPAIANYDSSDGYTTKHHWDSGLQDPTTTNLTEGFWYFNNGSGNEVWVENFSVNP